jgi:MFS family permease
VIARAGRLLINRRFALLLTGRLASNLGDWTFNTAVTLWITAGIARNLTWAPLAVAGTAVAVAVPTVAAGPLAGVFVDRWDRRVTMLWADALRAALVGALLVVPLAGRALSVPVQLGAVYGVVAVAAVCSVFFQPAQLALIGDLVPPEERVRASSLIQLTVSVGQVAGPALAAVLYFSSGVQGALLVDAASFLASFVVVRAIAVGPPAAPSRPDRRGGAGALAGELMDGLAFVARQPSLRALLLSLLITNGGASTVSVLAIFFLRENLHAPLSWFGLSSSIGAAAGLVGAAGGALLSGWLGRSWLYPLSVIAMGALVLVYSRLTSFGLAMAVVFLIGLSRVAIVVAITPILLAATPSELLGRVSSTINPVLSIGILATAPLAGALAAALAGLDVHVLGIPVGRIDAIFGAAGLLVLAAGAYALAAMREPASGARSAARRPTSHPGSQEDAACSHRNR